MYDELVKRLRDAADWADHFAVLMGRDGDVHAPIMRKAADAIEELRQQVEHSVPVPPHGRCIDADALADVFRGFIAMYGSCPFSQLAPTDKARRDELQAALAEVINAPTIIPAEEGE